MPLTNPRRFDRPPSIGEPSDWLSRVLLTVTINGKALKPNVVEPLAMMLAPGPRRFPDGLPAYWPADVNVNQTQTWAALSQRNGSAGRKILTAVAADLHGHTLNHVSGALLRLRDHETTTPRAGRIRRDGDPRGARRYQTAGRELLASLGAWPWTHAPNGCLPAGWHASTDYLDPLWAWHNAAVAEVEGGCEFARRAWRASEREWEPSGRD